MKQIMILGGEVMSYPMTVDPSEVRAALPPTDSDPKKLPSPMFTGFDTVTRPIGPRKKRLSQMVLDQLEESFAAPDAAAHSIPSIEN